MTEHRPSPPVTFSDIKGRLSALTQALLDQAAAHDQRAADMAAQVTPEGEGER